MSPAPEKHVKAERKFNQPHRSRQLRPVTETSNTRTHTTKTKTTAVRRLMIIEEQSTEKRVETYIVPRSFYTPF
eukprot:4763819-Amphidinium_carterae.1